MPRKIQSYMYLQRLKELHLIWRTLYFVVYAAHPVPLRWAILTHVTVRRMNEGGKREVGYMQKFGGETP